MAYVPVSLALKSEILVVSYRFLGLSRFIPNFMTIMQQIIIRQQIPYKKKKHMP